MNQFEPQSGIKPTIEKKKHPTEMLMEMLRAQSDEINARLKESGLEGLLTSDGALDPSGYKDVYNESELAADAEVVRKTEVKFSEFYRGQPGVENENDMIRKWQEGKSRQKSGQMEMAVTVLLSQMLGKDFLVVRTAPYDDYENGVDNLIVNRATGEVVGAFDEVHGSTRAEEKKEKILKIAKKGGAEIRYGLGFKKKKLKRAHLENIPVFYLGLEESELDELNQGLSENDMGKKDKIFRKLLASLVDQQKELKEVAQANQAIPLLVKLKSFGEVLSGLTKIESKTA
ncbi:MAG: hypothetical protein WAV15_00275 [Minisyncoccia bacterium]